MEQILPNYTPIIITATILIIIAFIGYSIPIKEDSFPQRILFENIGGQVVFDHVLHSEKYDVACEKCHHESTQPREQVQKCGSCHGTDFENISFKTTHIVTFNNDQGACVTCHHLELTPSHWNHNEHNKQYDITCQECHHKNLKIEPEPQNCSNCHQGTGDEIVPGIKKAVHVRCMNCHEEKFQHEQGCLYCHTPIHTEEILKQTGAITVSKNFSYCNVCHIEEKPQNLITDRMQAFHNQCLGCHEEVQKGPFKKEQCNQCHIK